MTEEKAERMVKAFSVTGTILLVVLFLIVGYQMIVIKTAREKKARLEKELYELQQQLEMKENDLEYYRSEDYMIKVAREYHYYFSGDITE